MPYTINLIGSHNRTVRQAPRVVATQSDAISAALGAMLDIYEGDKFHADDAARAFEFWTPDEIKGDLDLAKRCDIVISGGYYVIEVIEGA